MQIPIGRFSKMTRLSLKALRLYDQTGLLASAYVDPSSGYRYYKLDQARRAEVIRLLRSIDMPLDDIRVILDSDNSEQVGKKLFIHRERLTERLAAEQRMLTYLEAIISNEKRLLPREVFIAEAKSQWVATIRKHTTLKRMKKYVASAFVALGTEIERTEASTCAHRCSFITTLSTRSQKVTSRFACR